MPDWRPPEERVVITGMGAVTPCGLDLPTTWENVAAGRSGIGPITAFDTSDYPVRIAGEARGFDPLSFMSAKQVRRCDRVVQLSLQAALEAVGQSGLEIGAANAFDVGVVLGVGAGGIETYIRQKELLDAKGPKGVSPLLIPMIVTDAAAVTVSMVLGARGPNRSVSSACATGLDAIGQALEILRRGDAEAMIAGGAEAAVNPLGIAGFSKLGALSQRNDDPAAASRPFDRERDGFVLSEGGVVLVLETLTHARRRGAEPLVELRAHAATSDAAHLTAPEPDGLGAAECMRRALGKARLGTDEVEYINAHAAGTPVGDPIEARAIRTLFGDAARRLPVSSTKSTTGHLLGGAGALAVALTACALREELLPPTVNLVEPDPACELFHVSPAAKATAARSALVPCYGFGGHNSCIVVTRI